MENAYLHNSSVDLHKSYNCVFLRDYFSFQIKVRTRIFFLHFIKKS